MDAEITIGTKLVTNKFDRQIAKFESDMKKEEEKLKLKLDAKIQAENELKKHKQDIFDLEQEYEKLSADVEKYNELISQSKAGTNLSPKDFQFISEIENSNILQQYDKMGNQLDRMYAKEERLNAKVQQKAYAYKQVADKIDEYQQKLNNLKMERSLAAVEELKQRFNSVGSSIQNAIGKVAKLALGIFGIRSAYMAVRRASSYLATYDKQYAINLEYIRYVLTQAIAPVLRWIVNLAAKLLGYINAIMQGWFGINLFSKGSVESFNKMKNGANGVNKAVKEIKKQLAGFDEINMLTDQSDTGTASGLGGVGTAIPNFDLSALQGEPPKWLKWIVDNKKLILSVLAGIAAGLIAIKFGASNLQALGIGMMVTGIIYAIQGLLDYLKDPTWVNFGKVIQGIGVAITGLGIIIGVATGGWVVALVGAVVLIYGTITKYWENIKKVLQQGIDWLTSKSDFVHQTFGNVIGFIYDIFIKFLQNMLNGLNNIFTGIRQFFDGIINFVAGVFTGNWSRALQGIVQIFSGLLQTLKGLITFIWSSSMAILGTINSWIYAKVIQPVYNNFKWLFDGIKTIFNLLIGVFKSIFSTIFNNIKIIVGNIKVIFSILWEGIKKIFTPAASFFRTVFTNAYNAVKNAFSNVTSFFSKIYEKIKSIFKKIGIKVGEVVGAEFKKVINAVLKATEKVLNTPIRAINKLIDAINELPGVKMNKLETFSLPRLQSGGIINMPNRGTLIGGKAIGGERAEQKEFCHLQINRQCQN